MPQTEIPNWRDVMRLYNETMKEAGATVESCREIRAEVRERVYGSAPQL